MEPRDKKQLIRCGRRSRQPGALLHTGTHQGRAPKLGPPRQTGHGSDLGGRRNALRRGFAHSAIALNVIANEPGGNGHGNERMVVLVGPVPGGWCVRSDRCETLMFLSGGELRRTVGISPAAYAVSDWIPTWRSMIAAGRLAGAVHFISTSEAEAELWRDESRTALRQ